MIVVHVDLDEYIGVIHTRVHRGEESPPILIEQELLDEFMLADYQVPLVTATNIQGLEVPGYPSFLGIAFKDLPHMGIICINGIPLLELLNDDHWKLTILRNRR